MSWLARSIANSLKFDDDDDDDDANHGGDLKDDTTNTVNDISKSTTPNSDSPKQHSPSSTTTTPPRGVKEDLTALTSTFTRQLWGVASFLAPPPESDPRPISDADTRGGASDENDDDALIAGIRSDFAEIGGRFKTEISKLSGNKAVSEITKIASNFLQFGSEGRANDVDLVGVTDEVVAFARDVAMHPETWLDFPIPDDSDFEDFDMSDAQQEHALAVERLAPRLAALRMELCPGYMNDGCFWKIYFVLLHPRLSEEDAELLSTPQIVEARAMLSHDLKNKAQTLYEPISSGIGLSTSKEIPDLPREQSLSVPSHQENESLPIKTSGAQEAPLAETETCSNEDTPLNVATEVETEKHPVQSTEILIIDKAMVEEEPVNHTKHQHLSSSSSSKHLDENFEDDGDDWLKEDGSEMVTSGTTIPLENDEDVSFSDLEDDDEYAPTNRKKVTSVSDSSTKGSRDWVQLSKSSAEAEKDIKHAQNSGTKESNDWLDVDDIEIM